MGRITSGACALALAFLTLGKTAEAAPGHALSIVHAFEGGQDGGYPYGLVLDAAGNLYGLTRAGGDGDCNCGTVFKIAPDGTKTTLHAFAGYPTDGSAPIGIVLDAHGNIFGTTTFGGRHGFGSVFRLGRDGREKMLFSFDVKRHYTHSPHGIFPTAAPIFGKDANLYGTTWQGGINNHCGEGGCGTVFRITPKGELTTIYAFGGLGDGCQANSGLAMDDAGNLYGVTDGCGGGNSGTVYKIDPATGIEKVLHVFTGGADGEDPVSTPVVDGQGNVYGGTVSGGVSCAGYGCGTIFKVAPDGTKTTLYAFKGPADGDIISSSLFRDDAGNIFGVTLSGGDLFACLKPNGCGEVFELTQDGTKRPLHLFRGTNHGDGASPFFGLIPTADGSAFYGTTSTGPDCCGMIYKIAR